MKHGDSAARKFRYAIRRARRHMPAHLPAALFLTDPHRTLYPLATIRALPCDVGVVFRHYGSENRAALGREIAAICHRQGRTLLVSSDVELADHIGADGVHWPARMASAIPEIRGHFRLNTMSVHSTTELRRARTLGVDAILVSAVFPSASPTAPPPLGTGRLAATCRAAGMPVYALGGVTSENAERAARHAGVASVSGFANVFF